MVALVGCGGVDLDGPDTATAEAELVDMAAWEPATVPDPLPDHRPPDASCPPGAALPEGNTLEVDTGLCPYAFLQQPLLAGLSAGDEVEVVWWHSALVSEAPASGHLALLVGDHVLYERTVDIPAEPGAYTETARVDLDAQAGDAVVLHLHNHGANTWNLLRVTRLPSD